jgi:NADH:ubiquinone oxidoreductase subunit 2 (subunit N)
MLSCFNFLYLYFKLYLALGLLSGFGLAYLVVTLISISELRVFLIIISICHTIFIVLSILPCVHLEVALFYALAYILLTACSFILLSRISLRGLDFFADLQFAAHWPLFGLSLTLLVLSLSGLPPFLGF